MTSNELPVYGLRLSHLLSNPIEHNPGQMIFMGNYPRVDIDRLSISFLHAPFDIIPILTEVLYTCPFCHKGVILTRFFEDGRVLNCDNKEINPEEPQSCELCSGSSHNPSPPLLGDIVQALAGDLND